MDAEPWRWVRERKLGNLRPAARKRHGTGLSSAECGEARVDTEHLGSRSLSSAYCLPAAWCHVSKVVLHSGINMDCLATTTSPLDCAGGAAQTGSGIGQAGRARAKRARGPWLWRKRDRSFVSTKAAKVAIDGRHLEDLRYQEQHRQEKRMGLAAVETAKLFDKLGPHRQRSHNGVRCTRIPNKSDGEGGRNPFPQQMIQASTEKLW